MEAFRGLGGSAQFRIASPQLKGLQCRVMIGPTSMLHKQAWAQINSRLITTSEEQGVCHTVALPFTLKSIEGKRRIMEIQIFHYAKM
jgi:hypothetical protein